MLLRYLERTFACTHTNLFPMKSTCNTIWFTKSHCICEREWHENNLWVGSMPHSFKSACGTSKVSAPGSQQWVCVLHNTPASFTLRQRPVELHISHYKRFMKGSPVFSDLVCTQREEQITSASRQGKTTVVGQKSCLNQSVKKWGLAVWRSMQTTPFQLDMQLHTFHYHPLNHIS